MGAFEYTALDQKGRQKKGVLEGDTPRQIRQQLREKGFSPLNVVEVQQKEAKRSGGHVFKRGISSSDLAVLTRQFATLIRSGLPVEEALRVVSQQSEKPRISSMLMGVRSKVLEGHTLAAALDDFPHVFSELFRSTVAAGEQVGHLDVVLERLADYTEARHELKQKLVTALIYPTLLVVVSFAIVILMMVFVVPKVISVFDNVDQELPVLTVGLITISDFVRDHGQVAGLIAAGAILVLSVVARRPGPRRQIHRLTLVLPLIARMSKGLNAARFAKTLSILSASGVPVLEALRIASEVLSNEIIRDSVHDAATKVREGTSISVALGRTRHFPPMMVHLIASGESSGNLDEMLERSAVAQEREISSLISALVALFEPLMLLVMGGVVLLIVLAILLPVLNMNALIQ